MERAKQIVLKVGGIVSCVLCFVWLICGAVYLVLASDAELISKMAESSSDATAESLKYLFMAIGIMFFCASVFCIANAIVALKGKDSDNKTLMVLCIVFGVLSFVEITIVGAVFGFISISRKNNRKAVTIEE